MGNISIMPVEQFDPGIGRNDPGLRHPVVIRDRETVQGGAFMIRMC